MKFIVIATLLTLFIGSSYAKKKEKRWGELYKLTNNEIRTIKKVKRPGPNLRYRLFELYSEKIKLTNEKENNIFLKTSPNIRLKHSKNHFFKRTRKLYRYTKRLGLSLLKRYPRHRDKASILYTLALNSRDFGTDNMAERYLLRSIKYAKKNDPIVHQSKTSLAEYYYNKKKFALALKYYEYVLKNPSDVWFSKHLYNSAWCHFKVKDFYNAIRNIHRAYDFSVNSNYININEQIYDSLGLFHVYGKKIQRAIDFYTKNVDVPGPYFIKMAKRTSKNGDFKNTELILSTALSQAKRKKQHDNYMDILLYKLDIYREYKKIDHHFKTSSQIASTDKLHKMNNDRREQSIIKLKEYTGYLQIRLTKNAKKNIRNYSKKNLNIIIKYFDILISIDSKKTDQYRFYQGETFYSVNKYNNAGNSYKLGLLFSNKNNGKDILKFKRKILDSLLATISEGTFTKEVSYNFSELAYTNYLKFWPIDKKSRIIYSRLFNLYYDKKKYNKAISDIYAYIEKYPKDIEKQRAMLTRILDYYIKSKQVTYLGKWINKLNGGFLSFEKGYIDKATVILGKILFEKYQALDKKGQKRKAAKGYISVYDNDLYPHKIKAESAFHTSVIYIELGDIEESYEWLNQSFKYFPKKEIMAFTHKIKIINDQYYQYQEIDKSIAISDHMLTKYCNDKFIEKDQLYKNSIFLELVNDKPLQGELKLNKYADCNISPKSVIVVKNQILDYYIQNRSYLNFFNFYHKFKINRYMTDKFFIAMIDFYFDTQRVKDPISNSKIISIFNKILSISSLDPVPKPKIVAQIRSIMLLNKYTAKAKDFLKVHLLSNGPFKEAIYNNSLKERITSLNALENNGVKLINAGVPEVTLIVYKYLLFSYEQLVKEIKAYTPINMPKEFVTSFKNAMKGVAGGLDRKHTKYKRSIDTLLNKNDVISFYNLKVAISSGLIDEFKLSYPIKHKVTPIDSNKGDIK